MNPAALPLVDLTRSFIAGEMDAATFDESFRATFRTMPVLGDETFLPLDFLFVACDRYVDDPELREPPEDLDEAGLLESARETLRRLGDT